MALALNNLKRVDMPLNKETNQPTKQELGSSCSMSESTKPVMRLILIPEMTVE